MQRMSSVEDNPDDEKKLVDLLLMYARAGAPSHKVRPHQFFPYQSESSATPVFIFPMHLPSGSLHVETITSRRDSMTVERTRGREGDRQTLERRVFSMP